MYSLKNIRRIRGLDGAGVTASIYRDDTRIGWVQLLGNGGRALFTFDADSERNGFERFVETRWQGAQAPDLAAKMQYWVVAFVTDAEKKQCSMA